MQTHGLYTLELHRPDSTRYFYPFQDGSPISNVTTRKNYKKTMLWSGVDSASNLEGRHNRGVWGLHPGTIFVYTYLKTYFYAFLRAYNVSLDCNVSTRKMEYFLHLRNLTLVNYIGYWKITKNDLGGGSWIPRPPPLNILCYGYWIQMGGSE